MPLQATKFVVFKARQLQVATQQMHELVTCKRLVRRWSPRVLRSSRWLRLLETSTVLAFEGDSINTDTNCLLWDYKSTLPKQVKLVGLPVWFTTVDPTNYTWNSFISNNLFQNNRSNSDKNKMRTETFNTDGPNIIKIRQWIFRTKYERRVEKKVPY